MKSTIQTTKAKAWKATVTLLTIGALAATFSANAGKPPRGPSDVPLRVTIDSVGELASDGLGEYRNGEKGVTAVFTASQGRVSFDTGTRRRAYVGLGGYLNQGYYRINFLLSKAVQDPDVNTNPDQNWQDLHLDQLPITWPPTSVPVGLYFTITTSPSDTGNWRVAFGDYPLETALNSFPCAGAAPAIVTRVDSSTWTLEADDTDNHCLTHGFIDDRDFGQIAFPFKMTLSLQ